MMGERGRVYICLIVRMWCPPGLDAPERTWHSEVEHIPSGQRWHFYSLEEMLAFLATPESLLSEGPILPRDDSGPEPPR